MIHNVKIDDNTTYGKHILKTIQPKSNKSDSGIFIDGLTMGEALPEDLKNATAIPHEEVWDKIWNKLSKHYGVDVRNLK